MTALVTPLHSHLFRRSEKQWAEVFALIQTSESLPGREGVSELECCVLSSAGRGAGGSDSGSQGASTLSGDLCTSGDSVGELQSFLAVSGWRYIPWHTDWFS